MADYGLHTFKLTLEVTIEHEWDGDVGINSIYVESAKVIQGDLPGNVADEFCAPYDVAVDALNFEPIKAALAKLVS